MTHQTQQRKPAFDRSASTVAKVAAVSALALALVACRGHISDEYKLGMLRIDHEEMHPIHVTKQPATLSIPVHRGSYGIGPRQQSRISHFLAKYRARDMGNSKLFVSVPSGSANEVEAIQAVADLRHMIGEYGFDPTTVKVKPYQAARHAQPPIRMSYLRYVAKAPDCANYPTNLARQFDNLHYENYGCFNQQNLAAMVANPADLLGPRTMTPRSEERRRVIWDKWQKGESTGAERSGDEKADTKQ